MHKSIIALLLLFAFNGAIAQKSNKPKLQATYNAIKEAGIEEPDFVMAQSIAETGWLNCRSCCLQHNNLFGFYKKGNKCMKFDSEKESIKYYQKWQEKRYPKWKQKFPKGTYYDFLKYIGYAANPKYHIELKFFVNWVRKNLTL